MGGSKQPYMYTPVDYGNFNPKAYTHQLQAPSTPSRPKPDGPLINLNQHPDSFSNLPYGRTTVAPMNPNTKKRVKWARKLQLVGRAIQLFGAVGMLVCVICIRGTKDSEGWILRLPPSVDIAISLYGVYHLSRSATHRPPASSASYHVFSLLMDVGLVAFYAFTAVLGKANFEQPTGTDGRWRTFFSNDIATNNLLHVTWLLAMVDGGLHLVSLFIDFFLIAIFRKIAHMPPDMNPLEDNLTSRSSKKHKHKNSSLPELDNKRFSEMTATTASSKRMSQASKPLINDHRSSGVSFFQSRTGEDGSFSPHNPNTARQSQACWDDRMYQQPRSARDSMADLDKYGAPSMTDYMPSRITSAMPANPTMSKRSSVVTTIPVYDEDEQSSYSETTQIGNWEVVGTDDDVTTSADYDPYRASSLHPKEPHYDSLMQDSNAFVFQPLRMNPPTPELQPAIIPDASSPLSQLSRGYRNDDKENTRTQTMNSIVTSSSQYSTDLPLSTATAAATASKSRFYGDIAAAMRGVRQQGVVSPRPKSMVGSVHQAGTEVSFNGSSKAVPATAGDRRMKKRELYSVSGTVIKKPARAESEDVDAEAYHLSNTSPPRVVSRSGAEFMGSIGDLGLGKNRREVSGKVVEEGRGGIRSGLFMRKISGRS